MLKAPEPKEVEAKGKKAKVPPPAPEVIQPASGQL